MKVKVLCQLGNSFYPSVEFFWDFHQLWSSVTDFSFKYCFLKKLLCGSRRSKICDFCFNRPSPTTIWRRYCFGPTQPPYISKNDQKFFLSILFGCLVKMSQYKSTLKTLTPEILPNLFFIFYICWHYVISFWDFKTHCDGHDHRHQCPVDFLKMG